MGRGGEWMVTVNGWGKIERMEEVWGYSDFSALLTHSPLDWQNLLPYTYCISGASVYSFTPEVLWSLKRVLRKSLDKELSNGRNSMAPVKTGKLSVLT